VRQYSPELLCRRAAVPGQRQPVTRRQSSLGGTGGIPCLANTRQGGSRARPGTGRTQSAIGVPWNRPVSRPARRRTSHRRVADTEEAARLGEPSSSILFTTRDLAFILCAPLRAKPVCRSAVMIIDMAVGVEMTFGGGPLDGHVVRLPTIGRRVVVEDPEHANSVLHVYEWRMDDEGVASTIDPESGRRREQLRLGNQG
jgi:hypothetical protein